MPKPQKWWGEGRGREPKRGRIVNRNELAKLLGVVPSTINKWQELGMPVHQKGSRGIADQFDAADCVWWRVDYRVRVATANFGDDLSLRKLKAEVELKEAERDRKLSQLIPVGWLVETAKTAFAGVDETLVGIADEAAPLVAKETDFKLCHSILDRAVNNARRKLVSRVALSSLEKQLGARDG